MRERNRVGEGTKMEPERHYIIIPNAEPGRED